MSDPLLQLKLNQNLGLLNTKIAILNTTMEEFTAEMDLGETNTLLNDIKTLLTTQAGYLDGLEGFTDGIETLLTTISSYVDQLEGYVDGLETLMNNLQDRKVLAIYESSHNDVEFQYDANANEAGYELIGFTVEVSAAAIEYAQIESYIYHSVGFQYGGRLTFGSDYIDTSTRYIGVTLNQPIPWADNSKVMNKLLIGFGSSTAREIYLTLYLQKMGTLNHRYQSV